jgi:hypothetical protein
MRHVMLQMPLLLEMLLLPMLLYHWQHQAELMVSPTRSAESWCQGCATRVM